MFYTEIQPVALAILTSVITGGFVLVFVEIGNRKNRNNDHHDQIMSPFIHKLSSFMRFINWCHSPMVFPLDLDEKEASFKTIIDEMDKYGSQLIMSGGDYAVDDFSANQLYGMAHQINNIWYWHDKMNPCNITWDQHCGALNEDLIKKELKEISPIYLSSVQNVDLVARVAGDFFVEIYQPVENETFRYEAYDRHYNRLACFVSVCFVTVLLILCLMLFIEMPVPFLQISTVCIVLMLITSLILLAIDVKTQLKWRNKILGTLNRRKKSRKR